MAEVHALLYISGEALNTDEIMDRLQISRGNASMSIRALLDWGIVERAHKRGDRKEYFKAEQDVWAMFRAIVRERLKREVDPLVASLYEIKDRTNAASARTGIDADERASRAAIDKRLDEMLSFFKTVEGMGTRFVSPTGRGLLAAASLLSRLTDAGEGPRDRVSRREARADAESEEARR
jgi:DNA-binding transcriptional regulator GbsR (MarR family)